MAITGNEPQLSSGLTGKEPRLAGERRQAIRIIGGADEITILRPLTPQEIEAIATWYTPRGLGAEDFFRDRQRFYDMINEFANDHDTR